MSLNFLQIKETCLYVHDLEKARVFYHEKLGLHIVGYQQDKHIFFRAGSSMLLCFNPEDSKQKKTPPAHFAEGKQHFAFEVKNSDYNAAKQEIKSKGILITDQVIWESGQESFYFQDPEGNVLEILPDVGIWD